MTVTCEELRDSAQKVFPDWEAARDPAHSWQTISELGWFMLGVPEDQGGLGAGRGELAVIFAECGRVLLPGAVIAQFLGVEALAGAQDFAGRESLLEAAMAGELITTSLEHAGSDAALRCVPDADRARHVLVRQAGEIALVALDGAEISQTPTWDLSRRLFDVTLAADARRTILASGDAAEELGARLDGLLSLALAGDALGGGQALLTMTIDYLKDRRQFERPLAMFQALKHRVANLKAALVTAESLYYGRAGASTDAVALGAMKAHACTAFRQIAEDAVQLHGGVGLTAEYPVHLFLKRALLDAALGGDADYWEEQAGRQALAPA